MSPYKEDLKQIESTIDHIKQVGCFDANLDDLDKAIQNCRDLNQFLSKAYAVACSPPLVFCNEKGE